VRGVRYLLKSTIIFWHKSGTRANLTVIWNHQYNFNVNGSIRVAVDSTGCKLNQAEAEELGRQLVAAGCTLVSPDDAADIYILNTCTVTHVADRKSRQLLRMAKRRSPSAKMVVTGCYTERAPDELASMEEVDLVVGNEQKHRLVPILEEAGFISRGISRASGTDGFRTRAFIKIQDGCSNCCAYCIVPLVRGREKSIPAGQVIAAVRGREEAGYQEVVLTGTEIGAYRNQGIDLQRLLGHILAETGVDRVRLSSLQPPEISPEFIDLWQNRRLCRHFHLSLQSGSDSVLQRMKRRYTTAEYRRAVALIRETLPDAGITTDVIIGFPGETDAESEESYRLCRQMDFARIHVFSYSPRDGTEAARIPEQVKQQVKKQRRDRMLVLARESADNFHQRFLGKTMAVLWEKQDRGVWSGLTDNYIRVYAQCDADLTNQLTDVVLKKLHGDGVWGEL